MCSPSHLGSWLPLAGALCRRVSGLQPSGAALISTQEPLVFQQLGRKPVFHRGDPMVLDAFSLTPLSYFVTK